MGTCVMEDVYKCVDIGRYETQNMDTCVWLVMQIICRYRYNIHVEA